LRIGETCRENVSSYKASFTYYEDYEIIMRNVTAERMRENKQLSACVKKSQLDAQLMLSIFRQSLHDSGVSRLIIRRYNSMYTTICTYSFQMTIWCPCWIGIQVVQQVCSSLHNCIELHGQQNVKLWAYVKFLYVKSGMVHRLWHTKSDICC